jgi:hypothetical protein
MVIMAEKIYDVDPSKDVTPLMVRDAIITCFIKAHGHMLDPLKEKCKTAKEFEELKKQQIIILIKRMLKEFNADFNKPTKKDLIKLIGSLERYAINFRDIRTIKKHAKEIMVLINKLD